MYTVTNYKTKKAMVADFKAGVQIRTFQPGGMFPAQTDGEVVIEAPHYPQPHRSYTRVIIKGGIITKIL